jgi:metallo-beta-lactamase class B
MFASLALLIAVAGPADAGEVGRACEGHDGWRDPAPPFRIFGDTYYVGTCGVAAILVAGSEGHVLIDGATERAPPQIAANIARLGFDIRDVKLILSSHEHLDHAGGIAELQRLSGAAVAARAPAVPTLATGQPQRGDPQYGSLDPFPPVRVDRTVTDGETVVLGPIRLAAHATTGHTRGSTSWTWRSCEGERCLAIAYADSLTAVSAPDYRYSDHPDHLAAFRRSIATVSALPCDLLVTPHPGASDLFGRLRRGALAAPGGCRTYADRAAAALDARLAEERAAR